MNYKGAYDENAEYEIGNVVVFTDNVAYEMFGAAPAGTTPHEKRVWRRVDQPLQEAVIMFHGAFSSVPKNISDEAITLKDEEDNEYIITVDASGDTPELVVTLVEEEAEAGET